MYNASFDGCRARFLIDPTATRVASFFGFTFDTHGLSSTVKGYRTCIVSVLNRPGQGGSTQTISDIFTLMEFQRPGATPTLPQWDLGIVLEAPLREPSFRHFTLKTVFLLTMFSVARRSELHALRFDQNCIQFKPNGAGVTPYFSPEFMRKSQEPNQVSGPWLSQRSPLASQILVLLTVL